MKKVNIDQMVADLEADLDFEQEFSDLDFSDEELDFDNIDEDTDEDYEDDMGEHFEREKGYSNE